MQTSFTVQKSRFVAVIAVTSAVITRRTWEKKKEGKKKKNPQKNRRVTWSSIEGNRANDILSLYPYHTQYQVDPCAHERSSSRHASAMAAETASTLPRSNTLK